MALQERQPRHGWVQSVYFVCVASNEDLLGGETGVERNGEGREKVLLRGR